MSTSINAIAKAYVTHVQEGRFQDLINTLYSEDIVSVEAEAMPGQERVVEGKAALMAKSEGFDAEFEIHSASVAGPWPHGQDKFAVHMVFEMTHLASGQRSTTDEIAVMTVRDGMITKEEFFYSAPASS